MNYTEIIEEIKQGLTGDSKTDLSYLEKQAVKYRSHKFAKQIIDELSRLAYEILPDDRKQEAAKALYHNGKRLDDIYSEAKIAADVHDYKKAAKLMQGVVEVIDQSYAGKDKDYKSFRNPLDEYIYFNIFKPTTPKHKPPFNLSEFMRFYGYVLIELKMLDEAIAALERAVKFNPVNTEAYFELAEAYKLKKNTEMLYYVTKDTIKIATSSVQLAICYSNMGFYCIELEDYISAVCFYYQSMKYKENPAIVGELNFIRQKTGKDIERPSEVAIEAAFSKYDLHMGANNEVLNIAYSLGKHAAETNQSRFAKYCIGIVCDLTDDDEVKKLYETVKKL